MEGLLLSNDIMSLIDRYLTLEETGRLITVSKAVYQKHKHLHPRIGCFSFFWPKEDVQSFVMSVCVRNNKQELFVWIKNWIDRDFYSRKSRYTLDLYFYLFQYTGGIENLKLLWNSLYPFVGVSFDISPDWIEKWEIPHVVPKILTKIDWDFFHVDMSHVMVYYSILGTDLCDEFLTYIVDFLEETRKVERHELTSASSLFVLTLCAIVKANPAHMKIVGFFNVFCSHFEDRASEILCLALCKGYGENQKLCNSLSIYSDTDEYLGQDYIQANGGIPYLKKAVKYGNLKMIKEIQSRMDPNELPSVDEMLSYPLTPLSAEFVHDLIYNRAGREERVNLLEVLLEKRE